MKKTLLLLFVLAITASACSNDSSFEGTWAVVND